MLIKCYECDNTVSDKAKICPHCGVENPKGYDIESTLVLNRVYKWGGLFNKPYVYIDGVEMFQMQTKETKEIVLKEGSHTFAFKKKDSSFSKNIAIAMGAETAILNEYIKNNNHEYKFNIEANKKTIINFNFDGDSCNIESIEIVDN